MKKSDELRASKTQKIEAQKVMLEARKASETKEFTTEERTAFNALTSEIEAFDAQIRNAVADEAAEARIASLAGTPVVDSANNERNAIKERYSIHKVIRSEMGMEKLEGVEREMHQEVVKRAKESGQAITGVGVPTDFAESRADGQTVTQDSGAYGANLVSTDLQNPIEFLRPKPIVESLGARFLTGLQGDLKFPTNDGGISGAWEGEIATTAASKTAYGSKSMSPNRYGVRALLSLQNIIQSSFSLEAMTLEDIRAVLGNAIDLAAINGSGASSQPEGILNATGTNAVVGGTNGAAPAWSHIVDMETGIYSNNADAANMGYLINPATKGKLKQTKHEAGDLNYLMNGNNTINGYQVGVSNHVPGDLTKGTLSGTANAGIFGDFNQLLIGQWGFLDLSVDDKSLKNQGYVAIDVNTFVDVLVRQPKAFSVIKDWDIS